MTESTTSALWRMSATELAEAIRSKRASSVEVIEAHLHRIAEVNPAINTVTVILADEALGAAKDADRAVAEGDELARFHGVPFTVKANIDLVGTPTTAGLKMLERVFPTRDAPQVARMRAAGAIPLGRTNCPTLAVRWHTDSELWGATVNPWDRSRTPGASSGGEAEAIATGFYDVAGDPDPVTTMQSFVTRQLLLQAWGEFQTSYPLIVGPIFTDVPFGAGTDLEEGHVAETISGMCLTLAVNALGLPAVALPVGVGDGLPQAVQVIGARYREDLCLDAAAALEDRLGIITPIDVR